MNIKNRTGRWTGGESSQNAGKILDLMSMYDLYAINTHFEPKRGESTHTYLCPKPKNSCAQGDFGLHVGKSVSCRYKGNTVSGVVTSVDLSDGNKEEVWTVQFADGYTIKCGKRKLKSLLTTATNIQEKKQIDHILVSNRWRSSITQCRPRWSPSVHRSLSGKRSDHALLECTWKWKWRIRTSRKI